MGHLQRDVADPGVKGLGLIAVGVALPTIGSFIGLGVEGVFAFDLHGEVHERAHGFAEGVHATMIVDEFHELIQYNVVTGHVRSFLKGFEFFILEQRGPPLQAAVLSRPCSATLRKASTARSTSIYRRELTLPSVQRILDDHGLDTQVGDIGLHFATETQLSPEFLKLNNLYRHSNLNENSTKVGYFGDNGRVRCVKFRGNESMGLFMPCSCINFTGKQVKVGDRFETLGGHDICKKYALPVKEQGQQNQGQRKKPSRIIPNQFRFHKSTGRFGQNVHQFDGLSYINISKKYHGTSAVFSRVLCNRKLNWIERLARRFGAAVQDTEYDYVYSSRRSIKSNPKAEANSFYTHDIWAEVFDEIKDSLADGITIYGEIVGYAGQKLAS